MFKDWFKKIGEDGATSGDGLGAVLISRSQPKILRKIQKKIAVIYHRYHLLFACMPGGTLQGGCVL